MGRLITFLGFLLLIGGIGGMVLSSVSGFNFGNLASLGASPTTDQLCESGERLVEEKGSSQYTQGQGYASPVQYFCETTAGVRRDVTASFVNGLFGQASGFVGQIGQMVGKQFMWAGLLTLGIILMVIGTIITRIRSGGAVVRYGPQVYVNGQPVMPGGQVYVNGQPMTSQTSDWQKAASASSTSLADKLRQLENARNAGLITSDEYDRARQAIIKEM
jgi:hypothetical protein